MAKKPIYGTDPEKILRLLSIGEDEQDLGEAQGDLENSPIISEVQANKQANRPDSSSSASTDEIIERLHTRIEGYRIIKVLGEGGMGIVYLAEQQYPVRRQVALKIIKPGMDSKRVLARFEAEQLTLARLDHPNIAKVFDAGTTETGCPFFVMEYVQGIAITDFCDRHKLGIKDRLRLFSIVCQAIQHAHQKGIIHRDIKPSNVLVTGQDGQPAPKIIDFGVAKAIGQPPTERTHQTEESQLLGTPEYMSPEQAVGAGEDIDTRSDIYSLGVLLYVLLTGVLPFDPQTLRDSGIENIRKTIRETNPKTPSTRLASLGKEATKIAEMRRTEIHTLAKHLKKELEWIPLKAMRKERAERYRSASELADDIENYLKGATLTAGPLSTSYKVRKFVIRNKSFVASAATIAAILVLATVVSISQMLRANRAANQERIAAANANEEKERALRAEIAAREARREAEAQELNARRRAYASDINLLGQALSQDNLGRARDLLNRHRPSPSASKPVSSIDLRGWEWRYLWKEAHSDALSEFCRKTSEICSLAVSHDGRWVAVGGSEDDGASVWDLRTHEQLAVFHPEERFIRVAFSPLDPLLAFSGVPNRDTPGYPRLNSDNSHIRLWDGKSRQIINKLPLEGSCVGLQFSDDGKFLVSSTGTTVSGEERKITLWNVPGGDKLASYSSRQTWSNTGTPFVIDRQKSFAVYAAGPMIYLVDLSKGEERWRVQATGEKVSALALTRDGKFLASSAEHSDSTIRLWEVASGQEIGRLEGHRTWVGDLHFWPDGKTLASASADQTIRLWDVSDPSKGKLLRTLRGHTAEVWRIALLPDNRTLISGAKDGSVYLWDTEEPQRDPSNVTLARIAAWCFTTDGNGILTLDRAGHVTRRRGPGFREKEPVLDVSTYSNPRFTRFSTDNRLLAISSYDDVIHIWDLQSGSMRRSLTCPPATEPVAFLDEGNKLATICRDADSHDIWDLATGQRTASWPGAARLTYSCTPAFTPDERRSLTLCRFKGAGVLRDMRTGQETFPSLETTHTSGITFSPSAKYLATSSRMGYVKLWDAETLREVATLGGFLQSADSVAFSPDGTRLAAGSSGRETVKIWDVESHQELLTLYGQGSEHNRTAFSPDGNTLGSMNLAGQLKLWHAPSWEEIRKAEASSAPREVISE